MDPPVTCSLRNSLVVSTQEPPYRLSVDNLEYIEDDNKIYTAIYEYRESNEERYRLDDIGTKHRRT